MCGGPVPLESRVVSRCHNLNCWFIPTQKCMPWTLMTMRVHHAQQLSLRHLTPSKPRRPRKSRLQSREPRRTLLHRSALVSCSSRVVLRPGPGASQETAPSAEPSFAERTRGTVPIVARRVVAEYDSGEPPAQSPSRTSVTVTPLVDPAHRTPIIVIGPTNRSMTSRMMSQRTQAQHLPGPPGREHHPRSLWSLSLLHNAYERTPLSGGRLT